MGVFYKAAITNRAIHTTNVSASINLVYVFGGDNFVTKLTGILDCIIQDEHVQQPGGPISGRILDIRRVSTLSGVLVDQPEAGLQPGVVSA